MKYKLIIIFFMINNITLANEIKVEQNILTLLKYSTSNKWGSFGNEFPAGYHTVKINEKVIQGQRNPFIRIKSIPYDFNNKIVLDLACNTGGMLFAVSDKIKYGIGIDYNTDAINAANRLKTFYKINNIDFFSLNFEKDPLDLINCFFSDKIDICFILSIALWVSNWKEVVNYAALISNVLLYEAHGTSEFQKNQIDFLKSIYKKIILVNKNSLDDPISKNRSLYLCFLNN